MAKDLKEAKTIKDFKIYYFIYNFIIGFFVFVFLNYFAKRAKQCACTFIYIYLPTIDIHG